MLGFLLTLNIMDLKDKPREQGTLSTMQCHGPHGHHGREREKHRRLRGSMRESLEVWTLARVALLWLLVCSPPSLLASDFHAKEERDTRSTRRADRLEG